MRRSPGTSDADATTPEAPTSPKVSKLSRIVFWLGIAGGIFGLREAAFARNRTDDRRR